MLLNKKKSKKAFLLIYNNYKRILNEKLIITNQVLLIISLSLTIFLESLSNRNSF